MCWLTRYNRSRTSFCNSQKCKPIHSSMRACLEDPLCSHFGNGVVQTQPSLCKWQQAKLMHWSMRACHEDPLCSYFDNVVQHNVHTVFINPIKQSHTTIFAAIDISADFCPALLSDYRAWQATCRLVLMMQVMINTMCHGHLNCGTRS